MRTVNFKRYTVDNLQMRQIKAMKRKIGNSWGGGGLYMTPLERKFWRGGGSNWKNHQWEGYGYFLESHNVVIWATWRFDHLQGNGITFISKSL